MKKSLIIASLSAAIAFSVIGYASDFDLKSLSNDEITQLFADVEQEIVNRNINKSSELQPGKYVGGGDIPVGGYDITAPSDDERFTIMLIGTNKQDLDYYYCEKAKAGEDANFHVYIKNGYTLSVEGRNATITVNNGLNFK